MATKNYFSHTDSQGRDPFTRMSAFAYTHYPEGENIAAGYSDAQNTFNQWLNACDPDGSGNCSYAHRQNMLNPGYAAIGIGRAYNGSSTYKWYWTTDFGATADQAQQPPTTNPPTISFFYATPSATTAGQWTTLSWSVAGATSVSIDNGVGDVSKITSQAVSPTQTTTYTLTATNSGSSVTARTTITVSSPFDNQPPSTPAIVSATARSATEVDLVWTASSDNVGVAGYQVIRNGAVIASVSGNILSFADTTASGNTAYTYYVRAFDLVGNFSGTSNAVQVTTPAQSVPGSSNCPAVAAGAFTGCYYSNIELTGNPTFVRTDNQINFDWWSNGVPDKSLANGFSVRWQGNFTLDVGTYTFTALTSDGMRVYIDGNIVLDRWRDQPTYMYVVRPTISQGIHLITVEYYSHSGGGTAGLSWQNNSTAPSGQRPVINSFSATPATISAGQPAVLSWSVSGASTVVIDNGVGDVSNVTSVAVSPSQTTSYTLTATSSGGSVAVRTMVTVNASAGQPGGANCGMPGTEAFTGCYYNNVNLTGSPAFVRTDNQINFDWWTNGPPDKSVLADNFSVRWQGNFNFDQGSYTFATLTSDGVRLYIDGNLVIDRWRDQPPYMYIARPTLSQGKHLITLEYYDHTGSRVANLTWRKN